MKRIICLILIALLLTGCGKEQSQTTDPTTEAVATETTAAEETTVPEASSEPGTYIIREQVYYDSNDRQQAKLTVTLNDLGLVETVLMDSGADITYTPEYDENGTITAFSMTRTLYGEDTVNYAQVNDHGDIVKRVSNKGENETVLDLHYTYNEKGLITRRDQLSEGRLLSSEVWEYDAQGQKTLYSLDNLVNTADSHTLLYENTYENDRLIKVVCTLDSGELEHTDTYEYDQNGKLLKKEHTIGDQVTATVYTYNDAGLTASETTLLNGTETERIEYTYDQNGCIAEQRTYSSGEYKNRAVYSFIKIDTELTPAHLKIFKQFSIIP